MAFNEGLTYVRGTGLLYDHPEVDRIWVYREYVMVFQRLHILSTLGCLLLWTIMECESPSCLTLDVVQLTHTLFKRCRPLHESAQDQSRGCMRE